MHWPTWDAMTVKIIPPLSLLWRSVDCFFFIYNLQLHEHRVHTSLLLQWFGLKIVARSIMA